MTGVRTVVVGVALAAGLALGPTAGLAAPESSPASIADYYAALTRAGLIDTAAGDAASLSADVAAAEKLLRAGNSIDAAVALYAVVDGPRYQSMTAQVEYQSAEYYLAVALATAGAYDAALTYFVRVMKRGPRTMYFTPAHRRSVDIALETRDYAKVIGLLAALELTGTLPAGALGEEAYLRARQAYQRGATLGDQEYDRAERELGEVSRKSRLYSSALYLRGVMRARRGQFRRAAQAMCEIVDTPDGNTFTFVVDDRYFTIKDLARLGLGRIAHERGEYDDAYYHYFQIPDDSQRLHEALFEAAWSMYQKRELVTARDLVKEFLREFSTSPLAHEARLLAGYVELADCKFDIAQKFYDRLVIDLEPVVDELDRMRKDPALRRSLFERALARNRAQRADPDAARSLDPGNPRDQIVANLRLDPRFMRLHAAVAGLRSAAGSAPHVVQAWRELARATSKIEVVATVAEPRLDSDAGALLEDVRRLRVHVALARARLHRGRRDNTIAADAAIEEELRLDELDQSITDLEARVGSAAAAADDNLAAASSSDLVPMVSADLSRARQLRGSANELMQRLEVAADALAAATLDRLYADTRRVYDKARLGKIDAVIGQKRSLDIEVQDLAAGRYPAELHGRLWEQGLIGDDEEFWPFEGEYWADEYEGWR